MALLGNGRENISNNSWWSKSNSELLKFQHKWVINDFSLLKCGQTYNLDKISSKCADIGDRWGLSLRIGSQNAGRDFIEKGRVYIHLDLERLLKEKITAQCKLTILGENGAKLTKMSDVFCRDYKKGARPICRWTIDGKILFDKKQLFVVNDTVTIICEVIIVANSAKIIVNDGERIEKKVVFHLPEGGLLHDMECLINNEEAGDFTFKFGDKKLRAVKTLLSARSPVFATMFDMNSEFKENLSNEADILDIDYNVFREMLLYIYTDKIPKLNEMAAELLAVAEKYQLERLKVICEEAIYKRISIENALDVLILSDRYRSEQLKARTLEYIGANKNVIRKSEAFKSLLASDAKLAMAIILEVVDEDVPEPKLKKLKN